MKELRVLLQDFFKKADLFLLTVCCICATFGIVVIASATASYPSRTFVPVQLLAFIMGFAIYIVFTVIDIDIIADKWPLLLGFETFLLLLLIPFGVEGDTGNSGWLRFFGIGIQPSEIVKVIFIILMAKQLTYLREYKNINSVLSIVQLVVHFGYTFVLLMVTSDDLGSAIVFFAIFAVMLLAAGIKAYWFVLGIGVMALAVPFLWNNFLDQYQRDRILIPYVDSIDADGWGLRWQTNQSKTAMAYGRFTGVGYGQGKQTQSGALTAKHTDFIFASAGEELGMIACLAIMLLLSIVIIRCMMVGVQSKNNMSMLVCVGVSASFFFQMLVNTGMCIGITPVIGITLPFFSYGGSSLAASFAAAGLVSGVKFRPKTGRFSRTYH